MSNKTIIERMNKMKKNITAVFIALCMMFSILPVSFAASAPAFAVKLPSGASLNMDEEFTVDFTVTSEEKVSQVGGKLTYDTDALELVGTPAQGDILSSAGLKNITTGDGSIVFVADFSTPVTLNDTTVFSASFKVKAVPASGDAVFEVVEKDSAVTVASGTTYSGSQVTVSIPDVTISPDPVTGVGINAALAQVDGVDKTEYTVGEEVTYVITAAKAFNATGLQFDLDYDPEYLEFSSGTVNASGTASQVSPVLKDGAPAGKARLLFANVDGAKFEGTIATVTFIAKAATDGAQSSTKISSDGMKSEPTSGLIAKGDVDPAAYTIKDAEVVIDSTVSVKADKTLVSKGGQVTFTVSVSEVTVEGIQLGISFNNFHLVYNSFTKGTVPEGTFDVNYDETNKKLNIIFAANKPVTVSGEFATVTFDVADTFSYMFTPSVSTNYFEPVSGEGKYPAETEVDTIYLDTEYPAKGVEALIDAIGEVNDENYTDKEEAIAAAQEAYDALTAAQQETVANKDVLDAAVKAVKDAKADVQDALDAINAIGSVTADNYKDAAAAAADARLKYDALTDAQKSEIAAEDLKKLTDAEAAVKAYEDEVQAVSDAIDALEDVTVDNYKDMEKPVADAKAAYDALSDTQKSDITAEQKAKLDAAVKAVEDAKKEAEDIAAAAAVAEKIEALEPVTEDNYQAQADAIKAAQDAYNTLTDAQKAKITAAQKAKLDEAVEKYNALVDAETPLKVVVTPTDSGYSAAITKKDTLTEAKTIIVAGYDKNGIPVDVKIASSNDSSVTIGAADSVKVFVWDSIDTMKPFEDAKVVIE